jgi:osmotically-inducible protein OsmY
MEPMITVLNPNASETRDDVGLHQRLVSFLHDRDVPDHDGLQLEVRGGTVVVSGRLRSQRAKWLCLQCCRYVAGVHRVVDKVNVQSPK